MDAPDETAQGPPEERLARRLETDPSPRRSAVASILHEVAEVDRAIYRAVASTPTPTLDEPMRRLSGLANGSKLWLGVAGALFVFGGRPVAGRP